MSSGGGAAAGLGEGPAGPAAGAAEDAGPAAAGVSAALRVVGLVAAQSSVIGALLFYFGWARTQAALGYFGVSSAIAQLSVSDYILRSVSVVIRPLVGVGLVFFVVLAAHRRLTALLAGRRDVFITRAGAACMLAGLLLGLLGVLGFYNWVVYSATYPVVPILLAAGVTLVGYGAQLPGLVRPGLRGRGRPGRAQAAAVVMLDIVLAFWAVAVYANVTGEQAAAGLAASLGTQSRIVVFSAQPLDLAASGVQVQRIPGGEGPYRYRYSNLTLLLFSAGQYFVLPDGWRPGRDPVFLLKDDDGIRVQFYSPQ